MRVSVRVHDEYYKYMTQFGQFAETIDRLLTEINSRQIDFEQFDKVPPVNGTRNIMVEINNSFYIALVEQYGVHNYKISIRRMIYWFVDYDMGNEWGWPIVQQDSFPSKMSKYVERMEHFCNLALKHSMPPHTDTLQTIQDLIQQLKI